MKALVVFDTLYGNTERIARAIGGAIGGEVRVLRASDAGPSGLTSIDMLIVGSPTQGFSPTKAVQAFIDGIPRNALRGITVAAFDTRIAADDVGAALRLLIKTGGYAAPRIASALQKKGGNLAVPPEGFFVKGREGPLKEGEVERAAAWAIGIAEGSPSQKSR